MVTKTSCVCREIAKHLVLPPVKLHCSMLAEDAIKAAIRDIKEKRQRALKSVDESQEEEHLQAATG